MFRIFKAIQKIVTALNLRRNEVVSVLVRVMILGKSSQSPEELYNKIDEFFAKTLNSTEAQNNLKAIASKGRTEIAKRELEKARSFYYACSKCLVGSF